MAYFLLGEHEMKNFDSVDMQLPHNKESGERTHTLFLLLMIVLLFSDVFESGFEIYPSEQKQKQKQSIDNETNKSLVNQSVSINSESPSSSSSTLLQSTPPSSTSKLNEKSRKIQKIYIETTCRYLHDEIGLTVGHQMFQNLLPLLFDLQKLCATLANVNLCESAENADQLSSSRTTTSSISPITTDHRTSPVSSSEVNSTMISGQQ